MTKHEAEAYRAKIEQASAWTDDADALEMVELFPKWVAGKSVIVGERVQHGGKLWKCLQAHTTQSDWEPGDVPALWTEVSVEEWPEWVRPQGSADCYNTGDKVTFESKHYQSVIDGNVWSPTEYPAGWEQK